MRNHRGDTVLDEQEQGLDWSGELARGLLSHASLAALLRGDAHGYELLVRVRGLGFPRISGGTLYPLLRRLETNGLVEHRWDTSGSGPARKIYTMTAAGLKELGRAEDALDRVASNLRAMRAVKRG